MAPSVIVAGARTPIGRFRGGLASLSGAELGAVAIREALTRAGVEPGSVDYVIMGQVLSGMNPGDPPNPEKQLVPLAWIKTYTGPQGKASRVFTTTMGHGGDLLSRLWVNDDVGSHLGPSAVVGVGREVFRHCTHPFASNGRA